MNPSAIRNAGQFANGLNVGIWGTLSARYFAEGDLLYGALGATSAILFSLCGLLSYQSEKRHKALAELRNSA